MAKPSSPVDNDQYPRARQSGRRLCKALIKRDAELAAQKIGGKADLSDSLLEEVASLVVWRWLLPELRRKFRPEALVYTMKGDQKYFPVAPRANCCRTLSSWPTSSRKTAADHLR